MKWTNWCREREENVLFIMHNSSDKEIVATVIMHKPFVCLFS